MAGTDTTTLAEHAREDRGDAVVRNNLATRLFHAAVALSSFALLGTGLWLDSGREGQPSLLSELLSTPDVEVHRLTGWVLVGLGGAAVTLGIRAAWTFVVETFRADAGDVRWFLRWPVGALTGRFARHEGRFDPGQRLANLAFVLTLGTLAGTGVALTTLSGGPTFATLVRVHRIATYALLGLVVGHILLVVGLLPGYRGVWRAMLGTGRVPRAVVSRLWPADPEIGRRGPPGCGDGR